MCYYNSRQLGLLQIRTTFVTIYDSLVITILDNSYYNLRRLLLQFTIGITIHYRTHLPTEKVFYATATTKLNYSTFLLIKKPSPGVFLKRSHRQALLLTQSKPFYVRWQWPSHLENICGNNVPQRLPNQAIRNGSEFTSTIPPHGNWWES